MSLESGLAFFAAILLFAVTPGPGVFAVLARALISGARSCFFLSLGMAISDIIYLVLACFGLAVIAHNWGEVFIVIRWIGAAYLLYLGYKIWTSPISDDLCSTVPIAGKFESFLQGFMISASNPKVILFYIAFLPTFMDVTIFSTGDIILAAILTLIGLMLGLTVIASCAAQSRKYFKSRKAMARLNKTAGSIMIGAGSFLALKSP